MEFNEFLDIINTTVISSSEFIHKLKNQNLWTLSYTTQVIEEYKKFIYLGLFTEVSPSYEIDQVWHLHILYTKDYHNMCKKLNINFFHHNPTDKTNITLPVKDNYKNTINLYHSLFNKQPPSNIWTKWKYMNNIHLDLNRHWVVPVNDWKALVNILIKYIKTQIYGTI